jgi:two-component system chemotaxis response regulator CheB
MVSQDVPGDVPEERRVSQREIVAIGASAGGVEALGTLVAGLPAELPAAVLVVLHVLPTGTSVLPSILQRAGNLPAAPARQGEPLERGRIYVAPPDYHLLVADGHVELSRGPRENGHRPACDPLFRSVGRTYGRRAIGVILSGMLDDGAAGLRLMHDRGGATVVQDPEDALYPSMPRSAIANGAADKVVKIGDMADCICTLIDTPLEDLGDVPETELMQAVSPTLSLADDTPLEGEPTGLTCPECGGALWESHEGELIRFRCHVGHAYSPQSIQTEQARSLEAALWSALRSLEERAGLFERMAGRSKPTSPEMATRFDRRAREVKRHAEAVRQTIADLGRAPAGEAAGEGEPAA